MLTLTKHAKKRSQQRGITLKQLMAIMRYGSEKYSNKAISYFNTRESERMMLSDGLPIYFIEKCRNIYIIAREAMVITVCHNYKKTNLRLLSNNTHPQK